MNKKPNVPPTEHISRRSMLLILNSAIEAHSYRFARQAATAWLTEYPGDLSVNLLIGCALLGENKADQAGMIFKDLVSKDPEFIEAYEALALAQLGEDTIDFSNAMGCAHILGRTIKNTQIIPAWAEKVRVAMHWLDAGEYVAAEMTIMEVLESNVEIPLPAIIHLRIAEHKQNLQAILNLANLYHEHWQSCLEFTLKLADTKMEIGDEAGAVNLLHQCVSADAAGQVSNRIWGSQHRYQPLWPELMEIQFNLPIPAEVAAPLGWNKLAPGIIMPKDDASISEITTHVDMGISSTNTEDFPLKSDSYAPRLNILPEPVQEYDVKIGDDLQQPISRGQKKIEGNDISVLSSESVIEPAGDVGTSTGDAEPEKSENSKKREESIRLVEEAFIGLARRLGQTGLINTDGRYPMYIVLTSRNKLQQKYGPQTTVVLEQDIQKLIDVIRKRPGWSGMLYCPDDIETNTRNGLPIVDGMDPWKIKLAMADLDKVLEKKGAMIGALLIFGGEEIIPFHRLPNPTDDVDDEIPSDNPYSTLDSNYFVPEWPVGRMPDENGSDAGLLLSQIRSAIEFHKEKKSPKVSFENFIPNSTWLKWLKEFFKFNQNHKSWRGIGYSAAAWQRSSQAVYRQLGEDHVMLVSPPVITGTIQPEQISNACLGYYNLHGLIDSAEWYGQKDAFAPQTGPDYPVALTPKDIVLKGHAPEVIFTEACYGGHVMDKTEQESIALRFLFIGAAALVGSTCVSYGSITTPLIGADLLASLFWKHLRAGMKVGESLMQAKIDLAREMSRRQGFLDGEDQKTLISFTLFGDPLAAAKPSHAVSKAIKRSKTHQVVKTVCDRDQDGMDIRLPAEIIQQVKKTLEAYLPGLEEAYMHISKHHMGCEGKGHHCPTADMSKGIAGSPISDRTVVTVSKKLNVSKKVHYFYARATLDTEGKVIKLSISR